MLNIDKKTMQRHDTVCAQVHFNICKEIGAKLDKEHWNKHIPNQ